MGFWDKKEDDDRKHQDDRFWRNEQDHQFGSHREDFQYCRFCNSNKPFQYDRCKTCGNN